MDPSRVLSELSEYKDDLQSAMTLLREISRLNGDPARNLSKLKERLNRLDGVAKQLAQQPYEMQKLQNWASQFKQELQSIEAQLRKRFGTELEQELKKIGLPLLGQYPELRSGLFTLELDFDRGSVMIWYGPKQERLARCPLSPTEVGKCLEKVTQQLGAQLGEEEFLKKLHTAYRRALFTTGSKNGDRVPIIGVLSEFAYLLQNSRFLQDPRRENYRGYSRADFSYDLFRIGQSRPRTPLADRLQLVVATRAYTRRRRDFLWVPDDESGSGATYSHLQFKEIAL